MQRDSYRALLDYSFRLLSRKNYSEKEMETRLTRRGKKVALPNLQAAVKKVLERLKELGYVNDEKIVNDYFEYRLAARPAGKYGFMFEMRKKGISKELASSAWSKRNIDEKSLARSLIKKKLVGVKEKSDKTSSSRKVASVFNYKKKLGALLARRGFAPDVIWETLDELR